MTTGHTVAFILERERDSTIKAWLKRVKLTAELTDIAISDANRTRHLPKLFDELIHRLGSGRNARPIISTAAAAHGEARFAQGYAPAMLIEESRIFEISTFGTLNLYQHELVQDQTLLDVVTIADEADSQLAEAVRAFMNARSTALEFCTSNFKNA